MRGFDKLIAGAAFIAGLAGAGKAEAKPVLEEHAAPEEKFAAYAFHKTPLTKKGQEKLLADSVKAAIDLNEFGPKEAVEEAYRIREREELYRISFERTEEIAMEVVRQIDWKKNERSKLITSRETDEGGKKEWAETVMDGRESANTGKDTALS